MEKNKLGVLLLIGSEAIFFLLLIVAYVSFRNVDTGGPTAVSTLDPLLTGVFSLFLFSSSFTIWRAGKSLLQGRRTAFQGWLLATILLGLVFLGRASLRMAQPVRPGRNHQRQPLWHHLFHPDRLSWPARSGRADCSGHHPGHGPRRCRFSIRPPAAVESLSLYWHFVDLVWVVILGVVYVTLLV
ncbi:MAG: hypothetical protein IPK53_09400 [bacterium]|nr:hypothetical protein [bacterium]